MVHVEDEKAASHSGMAASTSTSGPVVGVSVGKAVLVGTGVDVAVIVAVAVRVGVFDGVDVLCGDGVLVNEGVAVATRSRITCGVVSGSEVGSASSGLQAVEMASSASSTIVTANDRHFFDTLFSFGAWGFARNHR